MFTRIPITTDAQTLLDQAIDSLEEKGWQPQEGDPEVVILESVAPTAQNAAEVAAEVPPAVFRRFGTDLLGVTYRPGIRATGLVSITAKDTAGYTVPAGIQLDAEGQFFEVVADAVITEGSPSVSDVVIRALEEGTDGNGLTGAVQPVSNLAFVNSIVITNTTANGQDAEDDETYLNRLQAELTLLAKRPITTNDYAVMAASTPNVATGRTMAFEDYDPSYNRLSANQASMTTDTTGWTAGADTTMTREETYAGSGSYQLKLVAGFGDTIGAQTTIVDVNPGQVYTGRARLVSYTPSDDPSVQIGIIWYDADDDYISDDYSALEYTRYSPSTGQPYAWNMYITAFAPPTAASASLIVERTYSGTVLVQEAALREGLSQSFTPGGTSGAGEPRTVTVAVTGTDGLALPEDDRTAISEFLESHREVGFVVDVISPTYNDVKVSYSYEALANYDTDSVTAAIDAVLVTYLSPQFFGTVGYGDTTTSVWLNDYILWGNKLIGLMEQVEGVYRVATLTTQVSIDDGVTWSEEALDSILAGVAPLPRLDPDDITSSVVL